jgi:hypothetical protein
MPRDKSTSNDWTAGRPLTRRALVAGLSAAAFAIAAGRLRASPRPAVATTPNGNRVSGEVATAWFDLALPLIRSASGFSPPVASRALAYAGLTLYEAVLPGMRGYRSLGRLFPELDGLPRRRNKGYDEESAANAALAAIFRSLVPTAGAGERGALEALEAAFEARFAQTLDPTVHARSQQLGRDVAAAIFAWSQEDGGHEAISATSRPTCLRQGPASGYRLLPRSSRRSSRPGDRTGPSRSPMERTSHLVTTRPTRRRRDPDSGARRWKCTRP